MFQNLLKILLIILNIIYNYRVYSESAQQIIEKFEEQLEINSSKAIQLLEQNIECSNGQIKCDNKIYNSCGNVFPDIECNFKFPIPTYCLNTEGNPILSGGLVDYTQSSNRCPNDYDCQESFEDKSQICKLSSYFKQNALSEHQLNLNEYGNDNFIIYQYIGLENGYFQLFPYRTDKRDENGQCKDYDPRGRSWYRQSTHVQKNLVFVVDLSFIYDNSSNARNIYNSILQTLFSFIKYGGDEDYIQIVYFFGNVYDCDGVLLRLTAQQAFDMNYDVLKNESNTKLKDHFTEKKKRILPGFKAAFDVFDNSSKDQQACDGEDPLNIMIFINGGDEYPEYDNIDGEDEYLNDYILKRNQQTKAHIMTVYIGQSQEISDKMRAISCQNLGIHFSYQEVHSIAEARSQTTAYYNFISLHNIPVKGMQQKMWSLIYKSSSLNVEMVTVSMPIFQYMNNDQYIQKTFLGIVSLDLLIRDLDEFDDTQQIFDKKYKLSTNKCSSKKITVQDLQLIRNYQCQAQETQSLETEQTCENSNFDLWEQKSLSSYTQQQSLLICCPFDGEDELSSSISPDDDIIDGEQPQIVTQLVQEPPKNDQTLMYVFLGLSIFFLILFIISLVYIYICKNKKKNQNQTVDPSQGNDDNDGDQNQNQLKYYNKKEFDKKFKKMDQQSQQDHPHIQIIQEINTNKQFILKSNSKQFLNESQNNNSDDIESRERKYLIPNCDQSIDREEQIYKLIHQKCKEKTNLTRCYGVFMDECQGQDQSILYQKKLILEKAIETQNTHKDNQNDVTNITNENQDIQLLKQMVSALNSLSVIKVVHRDIKNTNILMFKNNIAKLGDFDVSVVVDKNFYQRNKDDELSTFQSSRYTAPEQKKSDHFQNLKESCENYETFFQEYQKIDIYSLGISIIKPKMDDNIIINENIIQQQINQIQNEQFKQLLTKMTKQNREERINLKDLTQEIDQITLLGGN